MDAIAFSRAKGSSETGIMEHDAAPTTNISHGAEGGPTQRDETMLPDFGDDLANSQKNSSENNLNPQDTLSYPEGGFRGWSTVVGSFSAMFACFGIMNSIGSFQAYIGAHQLSHLGPGTTGWIFSIYVSLAFFCGAQVGPVFDAKGPKILVFVGSVLLVMSMLLLGNCTGKVS